MLGIMKATIGYAGQLGYVVCKGDRVVVTPATNMPVGSIIQYFVERIDNSNGSIGCNRHDIDIIDESEGHDENAE